MGLEDPEGESEGYILEKDLKETFEDVKAQVQNILKLAQVDATTEESPEEKADAETPAS